MMRKLLLDVLCAALLLVHSANAEWPADPHVNVPVYVGANARECRPVPLSDGTGGAVIVYQGDTQVSGVAGNIVAKRIKSVGLLDTTWPTQGCGLYATGFRGNFWTLEWPPRVPVAEDGLGGALVVYHTDAGTRVQHIRRDGTLDARWPLDGVDVPSGNAFVGACGDGLGGVFVIWYGEDITAQHVSEDGSLALGWSSLGVAVCAQPGSQYDARVVSDAGGGAYLAWTDSRGGENKVFVQHLLGNGQLAPGWPTDGQPVALSPGAQERCAVVADGAGGAYVSWEDRRSGDSDLYSAHVIAAGLDLTWPPNGAPVCRSSNDQSYLSSISDGSGGVIMAWMDYRGSAEPDIYAQRLTVGADVAPGWPTDGTALTTSFGSQVYPALVGDDQHGAIVIWQSYAGAGGSDVVAQHVRGSGQLDFHWPANGRALTTDPATQWAPSVARDGQGGAIVAWQDSRTLGNIGVYAQHVDSSGYLGPAAVDVREGRPAPRVVTLGAPSPTPMRTQTSFTVGLPAASEVGIEVLDALGRRVRALHRGTMARGWSRFTWDGRGNDGQAVAAGLYFVHARTSTSETSARVVVLSAE